MKKCPKCGKELVPIIYGLHVENNNEQVQDASRKVQNVDDRIAQIKTYIRRVENLMDTTRRF